MVFSVVFSFFPVKFDGKPLAFKIEFLQQLASAILMIFNHPVFSSMVLRFLKLILKSCSDKFVFLFWYSQIYFKCFSNSLQNLFQVCFKFAYLAYVTSICFRKPFRAFNMFQKHFGSRLVCWNVKQDLVTMLESTS